MVKRSMLARYGLTPESLQAEIARRGNRCDICSLEFSDTQHGLWPCIDHDHSMEPRWVMRGIVHRQCNSGIGFLGDNAAAVRRALDYLERYEASRCQSS